MCKTSSKTVNTTSDGKNIGDARQPTKLYTKIVIVETFEEHLFGLKSPQN